MDKFIEFSSKTQGRDKAYRVVQYASKLLGWGLQELEGNDEWVKKLSQLESHASLGRKFFRLGRSIESLRAAQVTINLVDPVLKTTLTVANINRALFLGVDNYLWMGKVGILKVDKGWDLTSSKFYFASIILSLVRDLYALYVGMIRLSSQAKLDSEDATKNSFRAKYYLHLLYHCLHENSEATIDLIKNICDLPLPGSKLGYFPNHNGFVGVCGTISSLIGVYQVANPRMKLRP
uniref:Peroxisomal membrane protein 11A-like n=1 Tax=Phallusia mammillata TaxID=59560 RepID=A0A6F9DP72_9ASCI|nr:peroxisomal membrane protein 11A-like [Phallusia mammillata]